ncbi:MAG: amidohydrolase [Flavobacteriales bacterium]|nr:amidohydrolase [Flavobacteriales bacterium]
MPETWPILSEKYGYKGFIYLEDEPETDTKKMMRDDGVFFRRVKRNCWDPEAIIKDMDSHNVDMMVLCTIPVLFNYWAQPEHTAEWSRFLNNHLLSIQKQYPDRFIGLGTLPMQDTPLALIELERIADLGMPGIEIGSNIDGVNLDDDSLIPIFEAAESLNMSIFIHPWNMMGENEMRKYWLPWLVGMPAEESRAICNLIFGGIFDKFPKLRVMIAHGGGSFAGTLGRISHGWHCRPDLVNLNDVKDPREYMGQFWVDGITHDSKALYNIMDVFGENRIVYGTDYPFPLGDLQHGQFIEQDQTLSIHQKDKLFKNNLMEFLNLEQQ